MNVLDGHLGEKRFAWIGSEFQPCLEKSVGGKYGRSIEATSIFFVQLCLELVSNEHTWDLSRLETICMNWLWNEPCLEKSVGGEYGRSTEAASVFFVQLCLELLSNEHTWGLSWWETICVNWLWISALPWKICWRKIRTINRSCGCFLCPVMFRMTLQWTYLKLVSVRND